MINDLVTRVALAVGSVANPDPVYTWSSDVTSSVKRFWLVTARTATIKRLGMTTGDGRMILECAIDIKLFWRLDGRVSDYAQAITWVESACLACVDTVTGVVSAEMFDLEISQDGELGTVVATLNMNVEL